MQTKYLDFEIQHQVGQTGEAFLDQWLLPIYKITDVSGDARYQQVGIDRLLTKPDGSTISVEYKVDVAAVRTGNLFFEVTSNDHKNIPGWGWSSQADYWIFLIPKQEILVLRPGNLRSLVWELQSSIAAKRVANKGYNTIGYPIPLVHVRKIAAQVKSLLLDPL